MTKMHPPRSVLNLPSAPRFQLREFVDFQLSVGKISSLEPTFSVHDPREELANRSTEPE
ncbi:MAG: hypothetical protein ACI9HK_005703 [Pirellulaceae bacterium]|jgi:hypothetical protein